MSNPDSSRNPNSAAVKPPSWLIVAVMLGILGFAWWQNNLAVQPKTIDENTNIVVIPDEDLPTHSEVSSEHEMSEGSRSDELPDRIRPAENTERPSKAVKSPLQVENQTIHDLNGRVVYKGTIDLKPTLDRIGRGEENRHRNDGTLFQNRENRLPRKPAGYYKEYVHPTKGEHGPGPQRIIIGKEGEVWYTPDHYKSFKKIK